MSVIPKRSIYAIIQIFNVLMMSATLSSTNKSYKHLATYIPLRNARERSWQSCIFQAARPGVSTGAEVVWQNGTERSARTKPAETGISYKLNCINHPTHHIFLS